MKTPHGYLTEEQVFHAIVRSMIELNMGDFTSAQSILTRHHAEKSMTYHIKVHRHTKVFHDERTFTISNTLYNIHNEEIINMIRVLLVSSASFARGSKKTKKCDENLSA